MFLKSIQHIILNRFLIQKFELKSHSVFPQIFYSKHGE